MAKKQSTSRKAKQSESESADIKIFEDFEAQPRQITPEQRDEMETKFTGNPDGFWRRLALATLAESGARLIEIMLDDDRDLALEYMRAQTAIGEYATRLRNFADMMESASLRIGLALCSREDMPVLMEEAKAVDSGQAVGHG
jgi:hypothetical protein